VQWHRFEWEVIASSRKPPNDSGLTAVADGSFLLITPFRHANVPPPMSAHQFNLSNETNQIHAVPIAAHFDHTSDLLAVLLQEEVAILNCASGSPISNYPIIKHAYFKHSDETSDARPMQICITRTVEDVGIAVLSSAGSELDSDQIQLYTLDGKAGTLLNTQVIECPFPIGRLFTRDDGFYAISRTGGSLLSIGLDNTIHILDEVLPESCSRISVIQQASEHKSLIVVGLTSSGRLYAGHKLIDNQCTSFIQCGTFLIFSTATHSAQFVHIDDLKDATTTEYDVSKAEARRLERGSKIVTAIASTMSLVLQMPRGNLETISPRPLVLQLVLSDLDERRFKRAFINCRKHRIDLNIFYDHDPQRFRTGLSAFIDQIDDTDHLNLFISSLRFDSA